MFTAQDLKTRIKQQPFVPFRILTSGGQTFDVSRPDMIWLGAREVHVGTPHPDHPSLYDTTARLALMHITGLQDLAVSSGPSTSNGQSAG